MTLNKTLVREFERDQADYGTEVALFNLLWRKAADDLKAIGVTKITSATRRRSARAKPKAA